MNSEFGAFICTCRVGYPSSDSLLRGSSITIEVPPSFFSCLLVVCDFSFLLSLYCLSPLDDALRCHAGQATVAGGCLANTGSVIPIASGPNYFCVITRSAAGSRESGRTREGNSALVLH